MRGAQVNPDRRVRSMDRAGIPAAALLLGAVAAGVLLLATPHGLGIASDSVAYLGGAANLLAGRGFSRLSGGGTIEPLTHFPPFYSLTLAGLGRLGIEPIAGARWANAALLGCLVFGIVFAIRRLGASSASAVAAGAFAAASPILFEVSGWALSEPLFLVLGLAGLVLLEEGLRKHNLRHCFFAGVLVGLAYLTRYVGVALVVAGVARILLVTDRSPRQKRAAIAIFLGASLAPLALWLGRNWLLTGTLTNRTLAWHPLTITKWKAPFQLVWSWLLPLKFTWLALQIMLVALGLGILAVGWKIRGKVRASLPRVVEGARRGGLAAGLAVFASVYTLAVLASLLWVDAATPVDQRIASPVYVCALILAVTGADRLWGRAGTRVRWALLATGILILASYVSRTWVVMKEYQRYGLGYASEGWRHSGAVAAVRRLPDSLLLYTNNPEAVYFFAGHGAYGLPQPFNSVTGRPVDDFAVRLDAVRAALAGSGGAVIVFQSPGSESEIRSLAPLLGDLQPYYEGSDGTVRLGVGKDG
ncbi:MAG: glycosyltransferase family 39 protein [Anaerolineales bacterium]